MTKSFTSSLSGACASTLGQPRLQTRSPRERQYLQGRRLLVTALLSLTGITAFGQANPNDHYLIGPGDILDVRIFNRPQLSRDAVRVDGRGMIKLPLIGEVKAACRTESELSKAIVTPYLEYLKNPNVEVFIKDYQSQPVMVIGAVQDPGKFQMRRRVSLVELVSLAGGATDAADGRIQVKHSPEEVTCGEAAKDAVGVEWFAISDLLSASVEGRPMPYAQPGDVVNLLEAGKVYVVGNVIKPAAIPLREPVTITSAVAMAGGVLPDSKLDKVRIIRQTSATDTTKKEIIVDLKAINKRQADDMLLQANDIVDIPTSSGKKFLRGLVESIAPTITRSSVRIIP